MSYIKSLQYKNLDFLLLCLIHSKATIIEQKKAFSVYMGFVEQ